MEHQNNLHYLQMFFIMIISGLMSTMNIWVDSLDHIYLSINDVYMILLMTGWMFFLMGIINKDYKIILLGFGLIITNIVCIRTQFMVTEKQYIRGMIPHHSMAIHMSKKLLNKETNIKPFLEKIIKTQTDEIEWMKQRK
jgi:Domain of unknown function (DUF305)